MISFRKQHKWNHQFEWKLKLITMDLQEGKFWKVKMKTFLHHDGLIFNVLILGLSAVLIVIVIVVVVVIGRLHGRHRAGSLQAQCRWILMDFAGR